MASIENIPSVHNDSEMEDGEIVDDLDDLSDISSEEEFLLRERLQVLENYNNVLERKKAKRVSILSGKNENGIDVILHDLTEVSANKIEENTLDYKKYSSGRTYQKSCHRQKQKKYIHNCNGKERDGKKKSHRKKRLEVKVVSESSEESDDEYRNKRRKLANAVLLNKFKVDTSLKTRLEIMCGKKNDECLSNENINVTNATLNVDINNIDNLDELNRASNLEANINEDCIDGVNVNKECTEEKNPDIKVIDVCNTQADHEVVNVKEYKNVSEKTEGVFEATELCTESRTNKDENFSKEGETNDSVDSCNKENTSLKQNSDDELEILRQHALKTKSLKTKQQTPESLNVVQSKAQSEEDDSDTADLRLICLKSALLKKAIEMKLKQKKRKKLKSKSISLQDDLMIYGEEMENTADFENNTDIESVDMDIGSDADDKAKDLNTNSNLGKEHNTLSNNKNNFNKEDELEEDEDLLRAKLLTSLSKNLPNLLDMEVENTDDNTKSSDYKDEKCQMKQENVEEKKFIINLEDSDTEGEHEATKNLTKMHMKLSEQVDFQQKLDLFLKSTRMKVENDKLPDVVQQSPVSKPNTKYIPKAVKHLPKSEQIEYRNLVKRMAELEKIKQARQTTMNLQSIMSAPKETLKPRNITAERNKLSHNIEERIAFSRKNIAEESAKMLKLKEEATKLLQKYKIVATELRNISTAITLNKREQRMVQNKLSRIRLQHQMLLKSSNFKHSMERNIQLNQCNNKVVVSKLQKENNPKKDDYKSPTMLKAVTVSVMNNLRKENIALKTKLSVQVDVNSNRKIVKMPETPQSEKDINFTREQANTDNKVAISTEVNTTCDNKDASIVPPALETNCSELFSDTFKNNVSKQDKEDKDSSEYQSPLEAFESTTWQEDPNAFLCPYEVGGSCRDSDCKFLHPKVPSHQ